MDYYKCDECGKVFDEFEMNYKEAQKDKKTLCRECREKERKEVRDGGRQRVAGETVEVDLG